MSPGQIAHFPSNILKNSSAHRVQEALLMSWRQGYGVLIFTRLIFPNNHLYMWIVIELEWWLRRRRSKSTCQPTKPCCKAALVKMYTTYYHGSMECMNQACLQYNKTRCGNQIIETTMKPYRSWVVWLPCRVVDQNGMDPDFYAVLDPACSTPKFNNGDSVLGDVTLEMDIMAQMQKSSLESAQMLSRDERSVFRFMNYS